MRVVVIGATGHIGGYLVPRLVRAGHEVTTISRGRRRPYREDPAWDQVRQLSADRRAEDDAGTFGARIAGLGADVVIDLVCFTPDQARQLVEAVRGHTGLLVHCGTVWVHGHSLAVPTAESAPRAPFGDYGVNKAAIEELLLAESRGGGLPVAVLHPGHISGPGWHVINPAGNLNPEVWNGLSAGDAVTLPNLGMETVHHVHADDVAQAFQLACEAPGASAGESFHVVSEQAMTLRGYAESAAGWFGQRANLEFLPWEQFKRGAKPEDARATWDHIAHSPSVSIAKAKERLGYRPRYSSLDAVREAVGWLADHGEIDVTLTQT